MIVGRVTLLGGTSQFALWEWAEALGAALDVYAARIATAGRDIVELTEAARARRQAEWAEVEAQRDHERVAARAAEAFRARDYRRAALLLESLGARLTPAEQKKLGIARKRI